MKRIIIHWTGGRYDANASDRRHYHAIVQGDGSTVLGDHLPEANESTADGRYAAHTRALNTGSIGLAMAGMIHAREHPFSAGPQPILSSQLAAFVALVADFADNYSIPITPQTVLTHAEVQPTLGVWQRGKWDITWLPGMTGPGDAVEVGDRLREMVRAEMGAPETADDALAALDVLRNYIERTRDAENP